MALFKHHVTGKELMRLYHRKDYKGICGRVTDMLKDYETEFYTNIGIKDQMILDTTVAAILYIFAQEDFVIPNDLIPLMVMCGHLMANLVAMSSYENTDAYLRHISNQPKNLTKILAMYTCRNKPVFNQNIFFDLNPKLASLWWLMYATPSCGSPTKLIEDNITQHFSSIPEKFELVINSTVPSYFDCTYAIPQQDKVIKPVLNKHLRKLLPFYQHSKKTNKKHIAVFTGRWFKTSAVYKSSAEQLRALGQKYELTLVHMGVDDPGVDKSMFKHVICTGDVTNKHLDLDQLRQLDCHLAYFPDIGMSNESVILSNTKVAPIMVTGYGHPVSTFGSLCDYFIGGQDVELPNLALENYSEKLVLVPGLGAHPVFPQYTRRYPKKDKILINCPWTSPKINYTMLCNLRQILDRVPGSVVRFFPAWTIGRYNSMVPCVSDLNRMFGDECIIIPELPYDDYLIEMEKASLTLDSWPFGGYNTIIDSLFVGCPVVALEGTRFYQRASSALLRKVGLESGIAHTHNEYIEAAVNLLTSPIKLAEAQTKLNDIDRLRTLLCETREPEYFVRAFDFILKNHETIQATHSPGPFVLTC